MWSRQDRTNRPPKHLCLSLGFSSIVRAGLPRPRPHIRSSPPNTSGEGHHGRHASRTETAAAAASSVLRRRRPAAWPIVRIACGFNLLMHGWGKVTRGPSAFVKAVRRHGLRSGHRLGVGRARHRVRRRHRADPRPVHAVLGRGRRDRARDHHLCSTGTTASRGSPAATNTRCCGGCICFAIALRGGGPYSLDRKLGKEL